MEERNVNVNEDQKVESMEDYADVLERSFRKLNVGDVVEGIVSGVEDTKVTVDLDYYAPGIILLEDLSDDPHFSIRNDIHAGDKIYATIKRMDDGRGNILLSKKEANKVLAWDRLKELLESKEVVSVKVSEAVKAGVVAYLEGIRAFIPASKLALSFVEEADLESYVGKTLDVQVITADEEDDKLVLSAKEILREKADEERKNKISNVEVGLVTEGTVESLQSYGAFIDLGNGISGLCHISQIANQRIAHPSSVLKVGQKVKVKVIAIKDGKLSLSMKALDDVMAKEITEEEIEYKSEGEATTTLADLLKKAGF
ncbi:small subunit ribosomal protein S1 [Butyrivibrio fibrisolvens]|uniref:Small subunit ribosomal protein S1 n=1 Tax=Butyrivibrio fibrisolvens TaxID=831 RepID=A0A1H9QEG2_BUTFI|nr:S1 RNA-binding domain-containing protein [Butyrivibrio fibrisolvens]SER58797.1 small subunit ribosomal protein S1 [Butyrivibrio fibrisolvens]